MIAQTETKQYTIEEYLELEIASETRSEYQNGEIIPMTGGTPNHNDIAGNLYILLKSALRGKDYRTFYTDQRLWIPDRTLYTYPDVMVLPKPLELQTGRKDTVVNPFFIAEVLSKSTKSYDRDEKFSAYRTIPTFQEYLLIDQYTAHVEQYSKTDSNKWIFTEYDDTESHILLSSIPFEIRLADIYEGLEFKPE
ncbi:Uma2 family endonuclease [Lusitaniella coriacea]|uniref:Uma2 family endonuclease n=1 Tax=Lusitaniella coriacea TaxID=1983105 RepID=UPI003CE6E4CA